QLAVTVRFPQQLGVASDTSRLPSDRMTLLRGRRRRQTSRAARPLRGPSALSSPCPPYCTLAVRLNPDPNRRPTLKAIGEFVPRSEAAIRLAAPETPVAPALRDWCPGFTV